MTHLGFDPCGKWVDIATSHHQLSESKPFTSPLDKSLVAEGKTRLEPLRRHGLRFLSLRIALRADGSEQLG